MCCLFGLLDYNNVFSARNKNAVISVLSIESEVRGKDATGIAYNANGQLSIYKRALPANKMRYSIPSAARYIMGHTRMTTQGSEKQSFNNHPFPGTVQSGKFALCHNGILYNDTALRKSESLPITKIQTDSFVAVQLIEKQNALNFNSLAKMAEKVKGNFTFTVIDSRDNLYIVKGSNPFCLYHFLEHGFYIYASTEEILISAITKLGIQNLRKENMLLSHGNIIKIDGYGKVKHGSFDTSEILYGWDFGEYSFYHRTPKLHKSIEDDDYIQSLKAVAYYYGYSASEIDYLLECGFSNEEIEDMLYIYDSNSSYHY